MIEQMIDECKVLLELMRHIDLKGSNNAIEKYCQYQVMERQLYVIMKGDRNGMFTNV